MYQFQTILIMVVLISCAKFVMSSNNASSTVTYTSISSDSNGPSSWGIPLENAGDIPDMDPYEEHVPLYAPEPEHPEHHVPSPEPEHPEHHVPSDDDSQAHMIC
ncbi:hypothetical protein Tco_0027958 [Tanacetum coccineum]